ncbi:MAG: tRNA (adenine(22)-N(1))-methyltransferase [Anaerovoracaceae bacterium]
MLHLSDRLKAIALEIRHGETMADIGTDHGFLPVYLYQRGICPHVILTDISADSLQKAQTCCRREMPETEFDLRQGDGLEVLRDGEVDTVVMAGIGGLLMTEILRRNPGHSRSFGRFILQPRSAVGPLRHWLFHHGYSIRGEALVREGRFLCEILTVVPEPEKIADFRQAAADADSIRWEVPAWYGQRGDDLTVEYLGRKLAREENIFRERSKSRYADAMTTLENIRYLRGLLMTAGERPNPPR